MSFFLSEYTKIDVGWGLRYRPHWGAYSAPSDPQLVSRGPLRGRRGMEERTRGGERGEERGKMEKRGEKRGVGGIIAPWLLGDRRPCR